ncbi:MAG: glycosyltransferase family 2 protein [Patescibacteria group bacterium]|nr:glycosyltransferase family 2 protein [Patescibacteria group bacterium]
MKLSLVLPIYNEEENIVQLLKEIKEAMLSLSLEYEVIAINDGSKDKSLAVLKEAATEDKRIKIISFKRNFGQTAALSAGFDHATGEAVIPLDADLQNDPKDISSLLDKLSEGYDIVSGWRKNRRDKLVSRKIPSWIANYIISKTTDVHLHDYGCTMKAYRREALQEIKLYGEMHRFIPAIAVWHGAKITEIAVNHRERGFGKTKYGISRTFRVVLDLLTVKFLTKYLTRPMHFFGGVGIFSFVLGTVSFIAALYLRFIGYATLIETPLPLIGVFFCLMGAQLVLMGLLAEMIMRNYFESQGKPTYMIKEKINF